MKKFGKGLLYVILALAVVHGIATFILGRRIEARLQAYHEKGEIVSLKELNEPKIPDAENGAILYLKAFKMVPGLKERDGRIVDDMIEASERAKRPELWAQAKAVVSRYREAFAVVEKAAAMPKCRFPVKWENGVDNQNNAIMRPYTKIRSYARLLCADALIQAKSGNADGAAHSLILALKVSESLKDEPLLIGVLVRVAIARRTMMTLQDVCTLTNLGEKQSRELDSLLAGMDISRSYEKAMQGERACGIGFFTPSQRSPFIPSGMNTGATQIKPDPLGWIIGWAMRPAFYAWEASYLKSMDIQIARARKPYRETRGIPHPEPSSLDTGAVLAGISAASFDRASSLTDAAKASISGSRIFLALKMHKKQFGVYPNSLDELHGLAPQMDPFSGKAFIYKRQGNGFLLYSIGENLKDDGARTFTPKPFSYVVPGTKITRTSPGDVPEGYRYVDARGRKVADIVWQMDR